MDELNNPIIAVIFWLVLGPLIVLAIPIATIVVGGVVLSPVTGLISGLLARRRGLDPLRFAVVGVVYRLMLGFPWLFVVFGMRGWNIPRFLIRTLYFLLYAAWFWVAVMWAVAFFFDIGDYSNFAKARVTIGALTAIVGWFVSLAVLRRTGVGPLVEWGSPEEGIVPYAKYVQPFAFMALVGIGTAVAFLLTA